MTQEEKARKWDELTAFVKNLSTSPYDEDDEYSEYDNDSAIEIGEYVLMEFNLM